jgi:tetratricopeptide (TPR) repeat protein
MNLAVSALVVLGMHRSGTSALTRLINLAGARLPAELLPASESNVLGYWEPRNIVGANETLLVELDRHWADPKPMPADWLDRPKTVAFAEKAKVLIGTEFGGTGGFVLKDPRLCRLMPVWLAAIKHYKIEPVLFFIYRNPVEAYASLNSRNGLDAQHAFLLWLAYLLEAELATRGMKRTILSYDALVSDWRSTLSRVIRDVGVMGLDLDAVEEAGGAIDPGEQHHRAPAAAFLSHPDASEEAKEAYQALLTGQAFEHPETFDRLRGQWQSAWRIVSPGSAGSNYARSFPPALIARSRMLAGLGDKSGAIEAARRALRLGAETPELLHHLGNLLLNADQLEEAEALQRRAIARKNDVPNFHMALSRILARLGRTEEAIEAGRKAADLRPQHAQFWHHLGNLLFAAGRLEEAESSQRTAITLRGDAAAFHLALSRALHRLGRIEEAIASAQRAAELAPENRNVMNHLRRLVPAAGRTS